jgi:membrane protease YdiL (CAAX protease family)
VSHTSRPHRQVKRQLTVWAALGLWAVAVAGASIYGSWHGYSGRAFVITLSVLAFFLAIQLLFAAENLGERFARRAGSHRGLLITVVPFLAYLIYLLGTNSFTWWRVSIAAAYVVTPLLLVISAGNTKPGAWQDYLTILAIFLPLKLRWLNSFWPYPGLKIGYVATVLLAISVAITTFLFVRQLDRVGYNIVWGREPAWTVLGHFGRLAVILIPLAIRLDFIQFDPAIARWKSLPADALLIFLLTAWPEELLFRGLLQNLLSRTLSSETGGWIAGSVVFGLTHITNNGAFPNWRYALLATVAGLFYGRTWRKTGSIFPAAILHALVDTTWHLLFRTL